MHYYYRPPIIGQGQEPIESLHSPRINLEALGDRALYPDKQLILQLCIFSDFQRRRAVQRI